MDKYTARIDRNLENLSDFRKEFLENLMSKLENSLDIKSELEPEYRSLSKTDGDYREILDVLSDEVMSANQIKMLYYFDKDDLFIAMNYFMSNLAIQKMKLNSSSD
jgi:hypothetical protein